MQAQRYNAAGNKDAVNFCQRFLNVHIGQRNRRNYPIEAAILEGQPFPCAVQILSVGKSHPGNRQTAFVYVEARDFIGSSHPPCRQVQPRSATQVEDSHPLFPGSSQGFPPWVRPTTFYSTLCFEFWSAPRPSKLRTVPCQTSALP